jgi:hypothetical protein
MIVIHKGFSIMKKIVLATLVLVGINAFADGTLAYYRTKALRPAYVAAFASSSSIRIS